MEEEFITYKKVKNPTKLYESLAENGKTRMTNVQQYSPLQALFFDLSPTNWQSVVFKADNMEPISCVLPSSINSVGTDVPPLGSVGTSVPPLDEENRNLLTIEMEDGKRIETFAKFSPMANSYLYMCGNYHKNNTHEKIYELPTFEHEKTQSTSACRAALVDGFFVYLTSQLKSRYGVVNGIQYYGSYLGVQNDYCVNVIDDLCVLRNYPFFIEQVDVKKELFQLDGDYRDYCSDSSSSSSASASSLKNDSKKQRITISDDVMMDCDDEINDDIFENVFEPVQPEAMDNESMVDFDFDFELDLEKAGKKEEGTPLEMEEDIMSLKSSSSIHSGFHLEGEEGDHAESESDSESGSSWETCSKDSSDEKDSSDKESEEEGSVLEDELCGEEDVVLNARIKYFPVNLICMEKCNATLDSYLMSKHLEDGSFCLDEYELLSIISQIVFTLLAYQHTFSFTHNDLHTNNVVYVETDKEFIEYTYQGLTYRVKTFGKIYKIIDFGRSIYRFRGEILCSDDFGPAGDAKNQYNTEPFYNPSRPRIDPNPSFDLCRFGSSLFDFLFYDMENIWQLCETYPVLKIIYEWCCDDNGINMLYKKDGEDRYPDFKLYKMITRTVHHHTPINQLKRPLFRMMEMNSFNDDEFEEINGWKKVQTDSVIHVNIDVIPYLG